MKHARWSLVVEISNGELASFCASAAFDGGDAGERGLCRLRRFRLLKETSPFSPFAAKSEDFTHSLP